MGFPDFGWDFARARRRRAKKNLSARRPKKVAVLTVLLFTLWFSAVQATWKKCSDFFYNVELEGGGRERFSSYLWEQARMATCVVVSYSDKPDWLESRSMRTIVWEMSFTVQHSSKNMGLGLYTDGIYKLYKTIRKVAHR